MSEDGQRKKRKAERRKTERRKREEIKKWVRKDRDKRKKQREGQQKEGSGRSWWGDDRDHGHIEKNDWIDCKYDCSRYTYWRTIYLF